MARAWSHRERGCHAAGHHVSGERILEVAAPILVEEKPAGTMIIGLNYREVDNILGKLMRRLALIGFLVLAVSLVSTRPFTTHVVSGLTRMGEDDARGRAGRAGRRSPRRVSRRSVHWRGTSTRCLRTSARFLPRSRRRVRAWVRSPRTS